MARRGYSLYDNYQLSNSTAIPQFQGDTGNAFLQVAQRNQGLYDTVQEGFLGLDTNLNNMQGVTAQDVPEVNRTRDLYKTSIRDAAKQGDLENMVPRMRQLGAQFANDARVITAKGEQKRKFLSETLENKDLKLTSDQKTRLAMLAEEEDEGLTRNAQGQLVGSYKGTRVDKNIDNAEKVDQWMKSAAEHSGGRITQSTDGRWMYHDGKSWDYMTENQIRNIITPAASVDQEYQGYLDMMGRIAGVGTSKITDPNKVTDKNLREDSIKYAKERGIPFGQALKEKAALLTKDMIWKETGNYAVAKYAKNNVKTDNGITGPNAYNLKSTPEGKTQFNLVGQGSTSVTYDWAQNYEDVVNNQNKSQEAITSLEEQMALANRKLESAKASKNTNGITQAEIDIDNLQKSIKASKAVLGYQKNILTYAQDAAVASMNIGNGKKGIDGKEGIVTSYEELKKLEAPKVLEALKKIGYNRKDITAQEFVDAVVNRKLVKKAAAFGVPALPNAIMKNGKAVILPSELNQIVRDVEKGNFTNIKKVDDLTRSTYKDVSKNHSITTNAVGLTEEQAKAIGNFWSGREPIYTPGTMDRITKEEYTKGKFEPSKFIIETNRAEGQIKLPDGSYSGPIEIDYSNTNLSPELRESLMKESRSSGSWKKPIMDALEEGSYNSQIGKTVPNDRISSVPGKVDANGNPVPLTWKTGNGYKEVEFVHDYRIKNGVNAWVLRNLDGTIVMYKGAPIVKTDISQINGIMKALDHD